MDRPDNKEACGVQTFGRLEQHRHLQPNKGASASFDAEALRFVLRRSDSTDFVALFAMVLPTGARFAMLRLDTLPIWARVFVVVHLAV